MTPKVRFGLLVGGVGALINIVVSTLFGVCGPFLTLLAGGLAGWLTARALSGATRSESATQGALAGVITGSLMLVGQLLGAVGALLLLQASGATLPVGRLPTNDVEQVGFWVGGIGAGMCFGAIGLVLAAAVGAGLAYMTWRAPVAQAAPPVGVEPAAPQL